LARAAVATGSVAWARLESPLEISSKNAAAKPVELVPVLVPVFVADFLPDLFLIIAILATTPLSL
jgi:hypothetical protein